ncbi:MAG: nucleotidyltransferase family protein [Candidatus Omnitrophota bacterium]|jgi:hypothetical protein
MLTEERLIRYCAGIELDKHNTNKIRQILSSRSINWAYFFDRARGEGVLPLAYKGLAGIDYTECVVPKDIRERLHNSYYTIAARNALLYEKLNNILGSFNRSNIEVILLKGMVLINTVYQDIALRPMYDIDLLIHRQNLPLVEDKLKELGYVNSDSYPEAFYKGNIMVDVHCELTNVTRVKSRNKSYNLNMDEVRQSARIIEINGQEARILSPEYLLIDLCLHLTLHHGLSGLIWFVDIARTIDYYENEINWNKFIQNCLRYKIYKPVYYVLSYVKEILGRQIPGFVLHGLKPKRQGRLEKRVFKSILSGVTLENIRFFFTLSMMESSLDRLRFLREITFPSPKMLSAKYGISPGQSIAGGYLIHFKTILSSSLKLLQKIS